MAEICSKRISLKKNLLYHVRRFVFIKNKTAGMRKRPASKVVNILDTLYIIESE